MGGLGRIEIDKLFSYSKDLTEVLKNKKDVNHLIQCLEGLKKLRSFCEAERNEVQNSLEEYQTKIDTCKQRIEEIKGEVIDDEDLDRLENELKDEFQKHHSLKEELRIVNDQIGELERQRVSVEDRKQTLMQCEKDRLKAMKKLSMELSSYASITNIVPNMCDQALISGHIVEKGKNMEKFEFDLKTSSFETCNNLWKMIDL